MFPSTCYQSATHCLAQLRARGWTLATAESCTGGLLGALVTEIPGSSSVFTHGYITYANAAKIAMLGVDTALLAAHGAVSEAVARAMAEGAQIQSAATLAVAITGIAGPGGATAEKPVGRVHIACARAGGVTLHAQHDFHGDRGAVRLQAVEAALALVTQALAAA